MPMSLNNLPNLTKDLFVVPARSDFAGVTTSTHAPRFLLLYGALRPRPFSRLLTQVAARLLEAMGGEVEIFD